MSEFNYVKAWFMFAKRDMVKLYKKYKNVIDQLLPLVGDLQQGSNLNIPMSPEIKSLLDKVDIVDLAKLSRAIYFYGHWKPGYVKSMFLNIKGEPWKISNLCDQLLEDRIRPYCKVKIMEGCLYAVYDDRDSYMQYEFGLATKENYATFRKMVKDIPLTYRNFGKTIESIRKTIGDSWDTEDIDLVSNESIPGYPRYLAKMVKMETRETKDDFKETIKRKKQAILDAKLEYSGFLWLCKKGYGFSNIIYYPHSDTFSIGWRDPLSEEEKAEWTKRMEGFPYKWRFS